MVEANCKTCGGPLTDSYYCLKCLEFDDELYEKYIEPGEPDGEEIDENPGEEEKENDIDD